MFVSDRDRRHNGEDSACRCDIARTTTRTCSRFAKPRATASACTRRSSSFWEPDWAGLGGAARHGLNLNVTRMLGTDFPFGILLVNLLGCFVMGILAGWFALRGELGTSMRLFLMTGVLGGFTTFSAFALDTATLWERGAPGPAALYVLASVIGSLAALGAGLAVARVIA